MTVVSQPCDDADAGRTAVVRPWPALRLGPLRLATPAIGAALSGYSDAPMRAASREQGAPFALHEVVLDRDVVAGGKLVRHVLDLQPDDHPVGGQLMGTDPTVFARAVREMVRAGYDLIDLNFGCPVPRVLGRCRGGFLLSTPDVAQAIVSAVLDAVGAEVPVTVKMRRGLDDSATAAASFFAILERAYELGVSAVTVHPRTVAQRYIGPADWEFLARVRAHLPQLVLLGSGDLFSPYDVLRMRDLCGVDGVTLARGAIGNPWIFAQVRDLLVGREPTAPTVGEQRAVMERHLQRSLAHRPPPRGFTDFRTHAIRYAATHPEPETVRDAFASARSQEALAEVLQRFYPPWRWAERSQRLIEARLSAQGVRDRNRAEPESECPSTHC